MSKDTFYFSHDYNARQNKKLRRVIQKHGMQGYGLFWAIIEDLYQNENILKYDLDSLEYDYRCDSEIIKSIINDFDLFQIQDDYFGSIAIQERIEERNKKSKMYSDNAYKRWGKDSSRIKASDCIFYVIKIYNDSESFIKCGITTESISRRYSGKLGNYVYNVLYQEELSVKQGLEIENIISKSFNRYEPTRRFAGYLECYNILDEMQILKIVMQRECKGNAIKENKVKENKVKENNIGLILPFNSDLFLQTWNILKGEPKWKKKTDNAIQASLDELKNHSEEDAIQMMKNSIAGGWQGLFPLKKDNKQINQQPVSTKPRTLTLADIEGPMK